MANIKSALKRAQLAEIREARNRGIKSGVKTATRKLDGAIASGNAENVKLAYGKAASVIDKAVSKGVLHKNTASRKKARLARAINRAATQG
ncbi:MAG: 30S ribosomal protein S20 [Actinobacteria bacterium]|nr:30S ribosomal protein S20 [Actinomycetota bacterium]